jgi:hypothetical protein
VGSKSRADEDGVVPECPLARRSRTTARDEYVFDGLAARASGFLLKDVPPEHLVEAVRIGIAGDALLAPSITPRLIAEFARIRPPDPDTTLRSSPFCPGWSAARRTDNDTLEGSSPADSVPLPGCPGSGPVSRAPAAGWGWPYPGVSGTLQ